MIHRAAGLLALVLLAGLVQPAVARPEYLARFQADPLRRSNIDGCIVCHDNPKGGGIRNEFGSAFEAGGKVITPMLRANFPDRFELQTIRLGEGAILYFADPANQSVVLKRKDEKFLIDFNALSRTEKDKLPAADNRMSFFISSKGSVNGGHLGGLAGADRQCQELAEAAGAIDRVWHAYLSTSFEGGPGVNAGDRIGSGPWYNAKGVLIARGVTELHDGNHLTAENALTEKGQPASDPRNIFTGSLPDGKAAPGMDCNNWTGAGEGKTIVGNFATSWNSADPNHSCSQPALLYCFAVRGK